MKDSKLLYLFICLTIMSLFIGCAKNEGTLDEPEEEFIFKADEFADIQVLRYQVDGFDKLAPKQKELCYYLSQAALSGRDIIYDQNYKHNLMVRRTLEAMIDANEPAPQDEAWGQLMVYAKRVFFSNGIHHHYSKRKFLPECTPEFMANLLDKVSDDRLPKKEGEDTETFKTRFLNIVFDPNIAPLMVNQDAEQDMIATSAVNFYEGVTQAEVEQFYAPVRALKEERPIWYGLNSKLMKEDGKVIEKTWKSGGMYGQAIDKMAYWIEKAAGVAENAQQEKALRLLAQYYRTGDLKTWDEYNIEWVNDTASVVDFTHGFIEVYSDPLGYRGNYEGIVSIKDFEATKRIAAIGAQAQWFEDNSPLMAEHKKANVVGITAKVITAVTEAGDAAPPTPIGINLPNSDWIRKDHGSKSVNLGNIVAAYDNVAAQGSSIEEFAWSQEEIGRARKYSALAGALHTDMHEVIGHASGQLNPGIGTPKETLKSYASTLEEARADLVALYYIMDQKLVDIGVMPSLEVGKAEYDGYIRNGLMQQLRRLNPGENLEEAHMRNRQLNAAWAFERGKAENVIERKARDGKTYFVVNDYGKLRTIFGELLREIQRIKSEGDYEAGKNLVETYGVKVDQDLLLEVRERYSKIGSKAYSGFIQPELVAIMAEDGSIVDVNVEYPTDFLKQQMRYGRDYSFLPTMN